MKVRKSALKRFAALSILGIFVMSVATSCQREGCPGMITKDAPVVEQRC